VPVARRLRIHSGRLRIHSGRLRIHSGRLRIHSGRLVRQRLDGARVQGTGRLLPRPRTVAGDRA